MFAVKENQLNKYITAINNTKSSHVRIISLRLHWIQSCLRHDQYMTYDSLTVTLENERDIRKLEFWNVVLRYRVNACLVIKQMKLSGFKLSDASKEHHQKSLKEQQTRSF